MVDESRQTVSAARKAATMPFAPFAVCLTTEKKRANTPVVPHAFGHPTSTKIRGTLNGYEPHPSKSKASCPARRIYETPSHHRLFRGNGFLLGCNLPQF